MNDKITTKALSAGSGSMPKPGKQSMFLYRILEKKFGHWLRSHWADHWHTWELRLELVLLSLDFRASGINANFNEAYSSSPSGVLSVVCLILQIWSGAALVTAANGDGKISLLDSYSFSVKKLAAYVWTGILGIGIVTASFVFFYYPGDCRVCLVYFWQRFW